MSHVMNNNQLPFAAYGRPSLRSSRDEYLMFFIGFRSHLFLVCDDGFIARHPSSPSANSFAVIYSP